MRKNRFSEEDESMEASEVVIGQTQLVRNLYRVYLDTEIGGSTSYRGLLQSLATASEDDEFHFIISSPGGSLEAILQIYTAILTTRARTHAIVNSYAASAATFPIMACDEVTVMPHSEVMFHGASYGTSGTMAKNARYVEYANTRILGILTDVYAGFFSDQEIEDMVNNQKDWYMTGEEVMARLQQREQYFIEKEKALLEAQAPSKPTKRGVKK